MNLTHLVINFVRVEGDEVIVGATDNERWRWDIEDGQSGADAKTIVVVRLNGVLASRIAISESAEFFCGPGDPVRALAMRGVAPLFDVAWDIKKRALDKPSARSEFFGTELHTTGVE